MSLSPLALKRSRAALLATIASVAIATSLQTACSSGEEDPVLSQDELYGSPYGNGYTMPSGSCKAAGGECLSHNAPSARGQGPANCDQYGRVFYGTPMRSAPLDCSNQSPPSGGWVECCVP